MVTANPRSSSPLTTWGPVGPVPPTTRAAGAMGAAALRPGGQDAYRSAEHDVAVAVDVVAQDLRDAGLDVGDHVLIDVEQHGAGRADLHRDRGRLGGPHAAADRDVDVVRRPRHV